MRRRGLVGACWPSPLQEEVLRVAVLAPPAAAEAWARLRPGFVLDDVWDPAVQRLLPLVQRNLRAAGVDDPDLPRLTGLRRRHWYENQIRLHQVQPALEALTAGGMPLLFLKGVPLALAYYGDLGLRPMGDVDVLVPRADAPRALDTLEALGWCDVGDIPRSQLWRTHHGSGLRHPDGGDLDLHWHLGTPLLLPGQDDASSDDFWAASEELAIPQHGLTGRMLCPTDLLLHVIAHGLWAGSDSTVRWIADSCVVLQERAIDWDRLVDQAGRRRIAPLVGDALRYLVDEMGADVPDSAITDLRSRLATRRERRLLRALVARQDGPAALGGLPHLRSYWAYTRLKWGPIKAARELPRFVAQLWDLERPRQVPAGALARARRRLAERRRGDDQAPGRSAPHTLAPPTVAVVVPTHLRPTELEACIQSLLGQDDPAEQLIVVRGRADGGAAEVLARHPEVSEVVTDATTSVERMHLGAAHARAAVVAFTDDDAEPRADWVARLRAHFTDPRVGAVGGRDVAPDAPDPAERHVGRIRWWGRVEGGHSDGTGPARDVQHLRGVNMAFRRELLRFPVGLRGPGAPGYAELSSCLEVLEAGARVRYDPSLLVDHGLADRTEHGADRRQNPSIAARADDAFNQTYTLLSYRPARRWVLLTYVVAVGDRSCGGALRCAVSLVTGDRHLAREWWPLLTAQRAAWRAWRAQPLRTVRPDEPFPETA
ncbi:MAG: nucleotidyltransferase family protein [Acidimicrobiales bacterium]